ncbi:MAG: glycosyltransferase [Chloroflexi bacterium]|nr:glycosyltransferase [Chloroflexota bacterium]
MGVSLEATTEKLTQASQTGYYGKCVRISVIIPVRPGDTAAKALSALRAVEYPPEYLEILLAEGTNPSRQRNVAAAQAAGEIVYFLDNDSEADIDLFRFVARSFADPNVAVVGGPSEILGSDSLLQKCFGYVLGSFFAVANVRCRYKAVGRWPQRAGEQKLILCNLGVRAEVFRKEGGLDERIYPNEENEMLNRLDAKGYALVYNPRAVVRRPHRTSLGRFVHQMFRYGRGRIHQFRLHPKFVNPVYFMPIGLLMYLVSLVAAVALGTPREVLRWYLVPLWVYLFASALSTARIVLDEEDWRPAMFAPMLILAVHLSYAVGMIAGLLHDPWTAREKVGAQSGGEATVRVLKRLGVGWE